MSQKPKQMMTSFDLIAITEELKGIIVGSRIENIYQLDDLTLLLSLYPKQQLIISAGKRVHLTKYEIEKPPSPSTFCQIIRKYLRGGIIEDIRTEGFERIITIEASSKDSSYRLVSEVFGKGNLILLNEENKIILALSYHRMRDRNIIRGETFQLPPSRGLNPLEVTYEQLSELKKQTNIVVKSLANRISMGGLYAEEVLQRSQIDKETFSSNLADEQIMQIYDTIKRLSSDLIVGRRPSIVVDENGRLIDVLPFPLSIYGKLKEKKYSTFNEAADEYFTKLSLEKEEKGVSRDVEEKIDEQRRILLQQKENLKELEKTVESNQLIGDLINIHSVKLQTLIQNIMTRRKSGEEWNQIISTLEKNQSWKSLRSVEKDRRLIQVEIDDNQVELDLQKNIYQNASRFYEATKEAREKIKGLREAISETEAKIDKANKRKIEAEKQVKEIAKVRERLWFEKFHWFNSSDGFLIIGGKDASTNELLIRRHMSSDDIVLHADLPGAPFVLIKAEGKTPSEETINEAAQLAASYSRAWREGLTAIDVYWVKTDQVSKGAPSGEYLSKGMFMIYGQKNYIHNTPLRLSIGIVKEPKLSVIGGPVSAIASHTPYRIEIAPGRQTSGKLAKEIQHKLAGKVPAESRAQILKLSLDEIQRFIPAGGSNLS